MELYIQIQDNNPINHPILGDNLRQAFPNINTENLPDGFAKFERIETPTCGVYQVYEGVTYEWDNNIVKDTHHIRNLTAEEITNKQNQVKSDWAANGYTSWVFDDETCSFIAPIPYPNDGLSYSWDEENQNWVAIQTSVEPSL